MQNSGQYKVESFGSNMFYKYTTSHIYIAEKIIFLTQGVKIDAFFITEPEIIQEERT